MSGETFGQQLRGWRARRGLSLRRLAELVSYDHSYLWELETGRKPASLAAAKACDRALATGGHLQALLEVEADDVEEQVKRRQFLGLGTAAVVGGIGIDTLPTGRPAWAATSIAEVRHTLGHLQALERRFGSGPLVPLIQAQVTDLVAAMDAGADSADVLELAGWAHMLAGWMHFDAGDPDTARRLYTDAHLIADMIGDRSTKARVAAAMSMQACHLGQAHKAVRLAQMGAEHLPTRGRAAALLAAREARGWALLGAEQQARAALHRAMDAHNGGQVLAWAEFFTEGEMFAAAGQVADSLGHHQEAADLLAQGLTDTELPPRAWASFALIRAATLARGGNGQEAISAAEQVMPHFARVSSARVRHQLTALLGLLPADDPRTAGWQQQLEQGQ